MKRLMFVIVSLFVMIGTIMGQDKTVLIKKDGKIQVIELSRGDGCVVVNQHLSQVPGTDENKWAISQQSIGKPYAIMKDSTSYRYFGFQKWTYEKYYDLVYDGQKIQYDLVIMDLKKSFNLWMILIVAITVILAHVVRVETSNMMSLSSKIKYIVVSSVVYFIVVIAFCYFRGIELGNFIHEPASTPLILTPIIHISCDVYSWINCAKKKSKTE